MTPKFEVGQRVRIQLSLPGTWADWARKSMQRRTGVVEEVKDDGERYLVCFDEPVPGDRPGRLPTTRFHFSASDLHAI